MRTLVLIVGLLGTLGAIAEDGSGLKLSGSVDLIGQMNLKANSGASDRLRPREAEILLDGPIDHLFDGRLSAAAHNEGGEYNFEIHEAYVGSTRLIPRSRFRLGQFFLGVGRLTSTHRHEWPFISSPEYHDDFFGEGRVETEGLLDSGVEYSYLLPTARFVDLTVGVTNGWTFGHEHGDGTRPHVPTHYVRLATYFDLPWDGGTQVALNYVGRRKGDEGNPFFKFFGLDVVAKWREEKRVKFLFQSEIWYRTRSPELASEDRLGLYVFPNYHLDGGFYFGTRWDIYKQLNRVNGFLEPESHLNWALIPTLSYQPSEFAMFRMAYNLKQETLAGTVQRTIHMLEFQATFNLGAHPAHDF